MRGFVLILLLALYSCTKVDTEPIPEGMVKLVFTADVLQTKTSLDGNIVKWTGDEQIDVWYQTADGKIASSKAVFESFSDSNASLSVIIPADADRNEFYAGVNVELSGSTWVDKVFTVSNRSHQIAYANDYDSSCTAIGARWAKSGNNDKAHFRFKNLHNLLKITINNQTGKTIDKITLYSEDILACSNSWSVDSDGADVFEYIEGEDTFIELVGSVGAGTSSYYFIVPVKNSDANKFVLDDMCLNIHFTTSEYYQVSNSKILELGDNTICSLADFNLTKAKLTYPYGAPFGTYWGTSFIKSWNTAGWTSREQYTGLASYDTREVVTAIATASSSAQIYPNKSGNERMTGQYTFQFIAAESGRGELSFWSQAGATKHTASVLKNGAIVHNLTFSSTGSQFTSHEIDVEAGDMISIIYNDTSGSAALYCGGDYQSSSDGIIDRRIRWKKSHTGSGTIGAPDDLKSDDQSSFFNEI